jgi:hypothetical protein
MGYFVPIFLRIIRHSSFPTGPFSLNHFSIPIGSIVSVYLVIVSVILMLPSTTPDITSYQIQDAENSTIIVTDWVSYTNDLLSGFNWASALVIFVIGAVGTVWILGARKWFKGPPIDKNTQFKICESNVELNEEEFPVSFK